MAVADTFPARTAATVGDFFALLKPRVMSLVVFTGLVGIAVAPGDLHPLTAFTALRARSTWPMTAISTR